MGTVLDPTKAAVPDASVTVTEVGTNIAHAVISNKTGEYVVTPLVPGIYQIAAKAAGFQTTVKSGIELQVGQVARVDIDLALGDTASVIQVNAEAPLVDNESGTLGQVITTNQIVSLPLNGRSFYELGRLTPGAALLPGGGNLLQIRPNFISGTTISGVRGSQITFLMDGVDTTDQHQGGTMIQTSIDALREFKVQQNGYTAEYSRAGGLFNATTKSGTNEFHGALFEFLRNEKLDARNFFGRTREVLKRNQFGGVLGGPLSVPRLYDARNRTFFFLSYEGERERRGLVFNNTVPSTAMLRGDFSAPGLNTIYDPLSGGATRTPFAGNVIPANRIAAPAAFFSKFIPAPNTAGGNAVFAPSRALDIDQTTTRLDHKLTDKNQLFSRWSYFDNRQNDPNSSPAVGIAPLRTRAQNVTAALTGTIGPTLIHEFRFNYLFMTFNLQAFQQGTDFNKLAGVKGFEDTARPGVGGSFPDIAWSGYSTVAGSSFDQRPKTQNHMAIEYMDNLTWVKGSHVLKFGAKIRRQRPLFTDSKQYVGSWSFSGNNTENPARPAGTGNSIADFLLGYPRSVQRAYPGDIFGGLATYWHFFVQDDIKVTRKLTVNVGLRYEYSPWLKGWRNQLGTFDGTSKRPIIIAGETDQIDLGAQFAGPAAYPFFKDIIQTSSQAGLPINITHNDTKQWAPRFGFAWQPFSPKTVIRGGYGLFYEPENSDGRVNLNMVPFKLDETVFNDIGAIPTRSMADPFLGLPIGSSATAPGINPTYTHMRMGSDQHWNLGVQRALTKNMVLEADYVGNKGSFLNSSNAANDPPAGPGNVQARRPFSRFSGISYNSQDMSSTYHSLQIKAENRYSAGFWYLASYTFSKSILRQNAPQTGGNTAWEKALSGFDIPQNFAFTAGYELPFGKNAGKFVKAIAGGWQAQGIFDARSGRPFTPTISRDVANVGRGGQRPIRIGSGQLQDRTVDRWFDKTAFLVPPNFTFGNSGGQILREGPLRSLDFSLFKQFAITEKSRLQFRAEAFNLTNTASFNGPGSDIDTAAGGRVTSTSTSPRQIQFALKYNF